MSGEYPFSSKTVSPAKCHEKPWDLWVSEIGHQSPLRDDDGPPASEAAAKEGAARRPDRAKPRYRRTGLHRLRHNTMSLHGLFPQMDDLNAAVCHMCGVIVKCSAAYRHLMQAHAGAEPLPPPPPPAPALRHRSRHKKEAPPPPPPPAEPPPVPVIAPPPVPPVVLPPPAPAPALAPVAPPPEVQIRVETGELPVVSIQDTEELPLGETLTDDIFAIMNSEGIQTADDIANSADWKNIIRDIGNLQDLTFGGSDVGALPAFTLGEAELAALAPPEPVLRPPPPPQRARSNKSKPINMREYDPNKHCGVVTGENPRPCTRSLTCKAHALSLRRLVEGRAKPFDTLLAEHRANREAAAAPAPAAVPPPAPAVEPPPRPAPPTPAAPPRPDLYSLLAEEPTTPAAAPTTHAPVAAPVTVAVPAEPPPAPAPVTAEVCWYSSCPRPLALCTWNASHAAGAVTLGKRYATVRSNIKSAWSRGYAGKAGEPSYGGSGGGTGGGRARAARPELRRLVVCGSASGGGGGGALLQPVNGHVGKPARHKPPSLDLTYALDTLLADEKC